MNTPFTSRLYNQKTTMGLQYPPKLVGFPFICELCTVRAHLNRELDSLDPNDIRLLALERARIIDLAHGWADTTLNKYLNLLVRHQRFRQQFNLPSLPIPNLRHPPVDENIILFWHMENFAASTNTRSKADKPRFNSVRAFRSAYSCYSTWTTALCNPCHSFKDRDKRLITLPTVGPSDTLSATMIAHGMAVRLGTHTVSSMALYQRHIERNQQLRYTELQSRNLSLLQSYDLIAAQCVELLGWLAWLRGTECFSLRRADLYVVDPSEYSLFNLPTNIGALLFSLLPATKSSQTEMADIVLAYKTSSGLSPGFWFVLLLKTQDRLGWTSPSSFLFRDIKNNRWTSNFYRTKFLFPYLEIQRLEGDLHLQVCDGTPGHTFLDKFYSFHTYRISGNTHCKRKRPGCVRAATLSEVNLHGRWRVKYQGKEDMASHYHAPSVEDMIWITLLCF